MEYNNHHFVGIYALVRQVVIMLCSGGLISSALSTIFEYRSEAKGCTFTNTSSGVKAYCAHLHLTSVPQDLPDHVISLDLSYNNLTRLTNNSFPKLQDLVTFNAGNNQIASIESATFWPLRRLRILILNHNHLASLSPSLFWYSPLVSRVMLTNNELSEIPHAALKVLPRMTTIEMSTNVIQSVSFKGLSKWNQITGIYLQINKINQIHQQDFCPLQNSTIHKLNMDSNPVMSLPHAVFSCLSVVGTFSLGGMNLSTFGIRPFLGMTQITKLDVQGSNIREILPFNTSETDPQPMPTISYLTLGSNFLTTIPPFAFVGFERLQRLYINRNNIASVSNKSFCTLNTLIELDISSNSIVYLPDRAFACIPLLQTLNVSGNHMTFLASSPFEGMPSILSIDLSKNRLQKWSSEPWTIPTLLSLDISGNQFVSFGKGVFTGLVNVTSLNASENPMTFYDVDVFTKLTHLRELHLLHEKIQYLNGVFRRLTNLQVLFLSNSKIEILSIDQFTDAKSLTELHMEYTQLTDTDLFDQEQKVSLFAGLESVEVLNLEGNYFRQMQPGSFTCLHKLHSLDLSRARIVTLKSGIFANLSSLSYLYLSDNDIIKIPSDAFVDLHSLGVLYLENNLLRGIEKALFAQVTNLYRLNLAGNQISTIPEGTIFPSRKTLSIDISRNPFTCTCDLVWFRNWLETSDINLEHPNQTLCSGTSIKIFMNKPILSFNPDHICGPNIGLITGILFSIIIVGLLSITAYYKRWWLNYKLFLLKLVVFGYQEIEEDENADNYDYQLNVMFHDDDEWWVNEILKPTVEERLLNLDNVVYGDEDLIPGMFYINAILHVIEHSYKTVLLLSNHSVEERWFMIKLRMALEHVNDTRLDKVILIFLEDIQDDHLPYMVRLFLSKNRPYMLWTEDEDGQNLFWERLAKSMRANRVIDDVIPL